MNDPRALVQIIQRGGILEGSSAYSATRSRLQAMMASRGICYEVIRNPSICGEMGQGRERDEARVQYQVKFYAGRLWVGPVGGSGDNVIMSQSISQG